jgi:hypothetical protein
MGYMRNADSILVRRPEGKRPLGRPWRRRKENIRIDLRKIGWELGTAFLWLRLETSGGFL